MEKRVHVSFDRVPELFLSFRGGVCVRIRTDEGRDVAVPSSARVESFGLADSLDDGSAVKGVREECEVDEGWGERVGGVDCDGAA